MSREIVDDVVREALQRQQMGEKYKELRMEYGSRCVQKQSPKITLDKAQYGLSELGYFAPLEKTYRAVQVPETIEECSIEICAVNGSTIVRKVTKEVFCLAKTLAYEQVSESDAYSDAISKVFAQFLPQVLAGEAQYKFTEDKNWARITRIFFRYGVDFIYDILKQKKVLWEIIEEE